MQNYVRNKMKFRKSLCDEEMQSYGRFYAQVQSKTWKRIYRKLKDNHFSSVCEEGEVPRTFR